MSKTLLPPPTPIALVICDNVYQDSDGKRALIGLFNHILAASFPAHHYRLCVFISITSLRPMTACKLDVVNAETDTLVVQMEGPLADDNSTAVCDLVFELHDLVFPSEGTYFVRFWGNDQILMQRAIEVRAIESNEGGSCDVNESDA